MSVVVRGVKNAFRNKVRSGAAVLILAIGIGLSLSMLVAHKAVENRIAGLKTQMGTTLSINPAGARGFEGGGEPLTTDDAKKVENVAHISAVAASLQVRLQNQDSAANFMFRGPGGSESKPGSTNLVSPIEPGTLGRRSQESSSGQGVPVSFSLPITATGINGGEDAAGKTISITHGRNLTSNDVGKNNAIVGKALAEKNSLTVGSTFAAYDQTMTVVGIFDQQTTFENAGLYLPLSTAQTLSQQTGEVSGMVATVDSIDNLTAAQTAIQNSLGKSKADVTSTQQNITTAIDSLESVQKISLVGFVAALIAAGMIIFMIMLVVVRERRREIGVLKAIGAGNLTIVKQFMVEGMVLVTLGAVVGVGIAFASSGGIANALVSSHASSANSSEQSSAPGGMRGGIAVSGQGRSSQMRFEGGGPFGRQAVQDTSELVGDVTASIGITTLVYGLLATLAIGIVGSAVPAWFIAKIRPVEVMRGE